jgi:uncharacterized protein
MKPRLRHEVVASAPAGHRLRILYASDLHLGLPWTRRVPADLAAAVRAAAPDVVLLGGDLVESARGLESLGRCVRDLGTHAPVAAIAGNHDRACGVARVRRCVIDGGATWLEDAPLDLPFRAHALVRIAAGGAADVSAGALNVCCLHDPRGVQAAAAAGFDLAFAGHLHGGQCVLFERGGRLYPGAWINPWTGLRFTVGALRLFVSLGMGDTLPLRFRCPHDVIVCDVAERAQ